MPLDYGQAAPKGFLLLEWLAASALGTGELAFRLVPLASGIASLFLFHAIARRLLAPAGALAALFFFAVGYWFLAYASDAHPYGLDLALSLAVLLLAIDARRAGLPRGRVVGLAAFGAAAVWFSNGAVLTLFGLGMAMAALTWHERGAGAAARALWPIAAAWGTSAAAAVWVATHGVFPVTAEYFAWWWRGAMVPLPRSADSALWLWRAWRVQLSLWHGWRVDDPVWTSLVPALALVGGLSLLRRRPADATLAASIVAAYVAASMARQYPYDSRLVLAPIAVLVIGIGESIGVLAAASWGRATVLARAAALALCIPPAYRTVAYPPPYQWTLTGAYLRQIRARWQPGDIVYGSYGRALELMHTAPRFGLGPRDYVVGPCDANDPRAALRAADALRGRRRVWLLVGPGLYTPFSQEYGYLRAIGVRRDSLRAELPGSIRQAPPDPFDIPTAYLFDLSDSTRLSRASADGYAISPLLLRALRGMNRWSCYGVRSPQVRESSGARGEHRTAGASESRANAVAGGRTKGASR